jgi:hypothetical protein
MHEMHIDSSGNLHPGGPSAVKNVHGSSPRLGERSGGSPQKAPRGAQRGGSSGNDLIAGPRGNRYEADNVPLAMPARTKAAARPRGILSSKFGDGPKRLFTTAI